VLVTAEKLAEWYAVERRTVTNWVNADPPCPSTKQGVRRMFDTAAVARWREERAAARAEEAAIARLPGSDEWERQRTRKMTADARLAELEVARAEGESVPRASHVREIESVCQYLRAKVLAIRGRWAPRVMGLGTIAEATALLDEIATDILASLRESADELKDAA
jgi:phage terminase Nu1 subunit (DNA packaging protein)